MAATRLLILALATICVESTIGFQAGSSFLVTSSLSKIPSASRRATATRPSLGLRMNMEQLQFVIHSDGRVEEKVTGVKGSKCTEITAEVEKVLGKVTYTKPTSEMFEEEVQVQTQEQVQDTLGGAGGDSASSSGPTDNGGKWSQY